MHREEKTSDRDATDYFIQSIPLASGGYINVTDKFMP